MQDFRFCQTVTPRVAVEYNSTHAEMSLHSWPDSMLALSSGLCFQVLKSSPNHRGELSVIAKRLRWLKRDKHVV